MINKFIIPDIDGLYKLETYVSNNGYTAIKKALAQSPDDIIETAVETAKNSGLVKDGDTVVLTAGLPAANEKAGERGITNMMRVLKID